MVSKIMEWSNLKQDNLRKICRTLYMLRLVQYEIAGKSMGVNLFPFLAKSVLFIGLTSDPTLRKVPKNRENEHWKTFSVSLIQLSKIIEADKRENFDLNSVWIFQGLNLKLLEFLSGQKPVTFGSSSLLYGFCCLKWLYWLNIQDFENWSYRNPNLYSTNFYCFRWSSLPLQSRFESFGHVR